MQNQKRLIQLFKSFIEKALIPQIKKFEGSLSQWNKFSSLMFTQNINFSEIQFYVDSLPNPNILQPYDKKEIGNFSTKIKEETIRQNYINNQPNVFNPNKTFGGQRSKNPLFPLKDYDVLMSQKQINDTKPEFTSNTKDDIYKNRTVPTAQSVIPGLERLYKTFFENQQKFDNFVNNSNSKEAYVLQKKYS